MYVLLWINKMSCKEKMIDAATGASPPQTRTSDVGCSLVHFGLSIQSTSGSGESFDLSPILLNQEKQKIKENIVVKRSALFISFNHFEKYNKKKLRVRNSLI